MPMSEPQRRHYGAALKRLRTAAGWSRRELSEEAGVGETTIKDIEGGAVPHEDTMNKLLGALDVESTSFGLMSPWMANQIAQLVSVAQRIPPERLPEVVGTVHQVIGQAARGKDIAGFAPNIAQIIVAAQADVDQNNMTP